MDFPKAVSALFILLSMPALAGSLPDAGNLPPSQESAAVRLLREQIAALKAEYESRIKELESRLESLEIQLLRAAPETESAASTPPSPPPMTPGALNPAMTVAGNLVARADSKKSFNEDGGRIDNKILLREAELDLRVPVDPYADGVLITALESETPDEFSVGIEEAYVNIKKLPFLDRSPLGLRLKAGRFRPLFGASNILHTHDLPQTFRPLVVQEFLGPEGFAAHGVSANVFLPTPGEESSLDFTFDIITGGGMPASPDPNSRMAYLGHLRFYRSFKDSHNVQLGWSSYYQPEGNGFSDTDLHAIDFMYRWQPGRLGKWKSFLIGGEYMFARKSFPDAVEAPDVAAALAGREPGAGKPSGFYLFTQWQLNRRTYAGLRYDKTDVLFDPSLKRRGITPFLSYYFSEFLRFRLSYERRRSDLFTEDRRHSVYAELNFVFGSHPPEPFWVNR